MLYRDELQQVKISSPVAAALAIHQSVSKGKGFGSGGLLNVASTRAPRMELGTLREEQEDFQTHASKWEEFLARGQAQRVQAGEGKHSRVARGTDETEIPTRDGLQ